MSNTEQIELARRIIWFKKPEEALENKIEFLNYLMTNGTLDDLEIAFKYYSKEELQQAINEAIPGIFDWRSWNFWHMVLGYKDTPALPVRNFITKEDKKYLTWKRKL